MLYRAILVLTLVAGARFRPNTYWSKRSGEENKTFFTSKEPRLSDVVKDKIQLFYITWKNLMNDKDSSNIFDLILSSTFRRHLRGDSYGSSKELQQDKLILPFSTIIRQAGGRKGA